VIFVRIIYGLWIMQTIYLTVAAIGVKRDATPHLGQSFGLLFALIADGLLPRLRVFRRTNFAPINGVASALGVLVCMAGMAVLVWARETLGSNWSQTVSAKEGHELVTRGPYRFVRHPMYAGGLLACLASAAVAGGPFVFGALTLGPLFLWRVGAEDNLMARQFPNDYPAYMQHTKALIPFVW
jgi:protein-S-isoprenylcysteine O-methyltransferase